MKKLTPKWLLESTFNDIERLCSKKFREDLWKNKPLTEKALLVQGMWLFGLFFVEIAAGLLLMNKNVHYKVALFLFVIVSAPFIWNFSIQKVDNFLKKEQK